MAKLIAVWGSPNAGKSTFSFLLARAIYDEYTSKVICVFTDVTSPDMPVFFPNENKDDLKSFGELLEKPDITSTILFNYLYTHKSRNNLAFFGYLHGENKYTYAEYTFDKASAFLATAATISDFVIVDCGCFLNNSPLVTAAIRKANIIFQICSPDYKSLSYFSSQLSLYKDMDYRIDDHIQVMNINENDVFPPVQEISQYYKNLQFVLPYDVSIKKNLYRGTLINTSLSKAYKKEMKKIVEKVV